MLFFPPTPAGGAPPVEAVLLGGLRSTLSEAYADYRERGGYRELEACALAHLGSVDVEAIDRDFAHEWAPRLYPKLAKAEQVARLVSPLVEILNLPPAEPGTDAWWAERKLERDAKDELERQRFIERLCPAVVEEAEDFEYDWANIDPYGMHEPRGRWASITPLKAPGPPPDPSPRSENSYIAIRPGSPRWWAYDHRGQWRPPETPSARTRGRPRKHPRRLSLSSAKAAGQPRKYSSNAARQKAYRERKKGG